MAGRKILSMLPRSALANSEAKDQSGCCSHCLKPQAGAWLPDYLLARHRGEICHCSGRRCKNLPGRRCNRGGRRYAQRGCGELPYRAHSHRDNYWRLHAAAQVQQTLVGDPGGQVYGRIRNPHPMLALGIVANCRLNNYSARWCLERLEYPCPWYTILHLFALDFGSCCTETLRLSDAYGEPNRPCLAAHRDDALADAYKTCTKDLRCLRAPSNRNSCIAPVP